jgi:hypothetical protein
LIGYLLASRQESNYRVTHNGFVNIFANPDYWMKGFACYVMTKRKTKEKSQHQSKVQPIKSRAITAGYRQRDMRIDTLRGLLLIVMTIDHFNSPIAKVTYQTFGYVSVAEGFFFLSAYVFSIVYAKQAQNLSMLAIASVKRAYLLYRYHIALIVTVFLLAMVFPLFQKAWVFMVGEVLIEQTFAAFIQGLIFINQPVFMDILPMYCVFVLISPFILAGFSRGWIAQVFVVSFAFWVNRLIRWIGLPVFSRGAEPDTLTGFPGSSFGLAVCI